MNYAHPPTGSFPLFLARVQFRERSQQEFANLFLMPSPFWRRALLTPNLLNLVPRDERVIRVHNRLQPFGCADAQEASLVNQVRNIVAFFFPKRRISYNFTRATWRNWPCIA
jgi:hypothetical protein